MSALQTHTPTQQARSYRCAGVAAYVHASPARIVPFAQNADLLWHLTLTPFILPSSNPNNIANPDKAAVEYPGSNSAVASHGVITARPEQGFHS